MPRHFRVEHATDPAKLRRMREAIADGISHADFRSRFGLPLEAGRQIIANGGQSPEHAKAAAKLGVPVDEYVERRSKGFVRCAGYQRDAHWVLGRDGGLCGECSVAKARESEGPWLTEEVCPYRPGGAAATAWHRRYENRQLALVLVVEALVRMLAGDEQAMRRAA